MVKENWRAISISDKKESIVEILLVTFRFIIGTYLKIVCDYN